MRTRRLDLPGLLALAVLMTAGVGVAHAAGTAPGFDITNQATVDYQDANGNDYQELSNIVTTTVSQGASVDVSPDNANPNATPGDSIYYAHTITNFSNDTDTIDVTASSTQGWTLTLWHDVNGDGLKDALDVLMTDSGGTADPDTGVLAVDGTFDILVQVDVPAAAGNGDVDVTTVTGTSVFDPTVSDDATDTTTLQAPVLAVVKSVAPLGDQPPGTTLTYTMDVTNSGTAAALNVILTDPIPTNTSYVLESMTLDGGWVTDANLDDEGDYNITNPGKITVDMSPIAAGATRTVTFQVTID